MEIDNPNSNNISDNKFSINVLQLLKSAQMQHGLRHGDYTRYRRYCTARLRRLYKSLKFTHGRGKYTRKTITESTVTEVRFLHLVLYTAERAWSHAMEKRQLPDGPNSRQRIYLIGRLRKAVKWATLFAQLCAIKGDSRTSLEAEAYASYMKGNLLFEQDQNWDTALMNFKSARAVYEELGKYGDLENQVLCRERVEELEPSIRYCLHKIGESNLQASELLQIGEMEGPALDLFKAKLEAVMAEARSQQAASMTEFHWLGHRFPISNAKTRVAIVKAQELEKDLHGPAADSLPAEKRLAIFDKIFTAYHEARSCIRSDLVSAGNAENVKDDLNGLDKAVSAVLGQRTIERNQLLVTLAKSKLTRRRDDKNEKVTKPEELVRLYDLLLQNTADLLDLVSSGRDRKPEELAFFEECAFSELKISCDFLNARKEVNQFNVNNRWRKRGIAIVPTKFGISFTAKFMNQAGALVHVYTDGTVLVTHGGVEMGQGLHTKVAQIAASAFNIPLSSVFISETSTDKVPNSSPTAASASSDIYGSAVLDACEQIKARMAPIASEHNFDSFAKLANACYMARIDLSAHGFYITPELDFDWKTGKGNPFKYYTYGAAFAEVEIDTLTGDFHTRAANVILDLGYSLNPAIDVGQIEGAFIQGLGWVALEELKWGDAAHKWIPPGCLYTCGPGSYKIPSMNDVPFKFNVSLLKGHPNVKAIHSSKAVGEPPFFLASAVFFAIKDAITAARAEVGCNDWFPLDNPATPERIRMACLDEFTAPFISSDFHPKLSV